MNCEELLRGVEKDVTEPEPELEDMAIVGIKVLKTELLKLLLLLTVCRAVTIVEELDNEVMSR